MRSENRSEDEAPVDGGGRLAKWRELVLSKEVGVIDSISAWLSRLRNRLGAAPNDEDSSGDGRGKPQAHAGDAVAAEVLAPPKPRRLAQFFIFLMFLVIGTIAGAAFSYRLLAKAINTKDVTIENLRDELAETKKQESLNLKQIDQSQQMIRDYDKSAAGYLKELEDSRAQVEELRSQLNAVKNVRREAASQPVRSSPRPTAAAGRAAPQKAGTCTMDSAKDAANLARCIEEFNRK
jgi:hypothetical protein